MKEIWTMPVQPATAKIGSVLDLMEAGAMAHANALGYGREHMVRVHGCAWMVARVWVRLFAPIKLEPQILKTWTRPIHGGMCRREFDLLHQGRLVGESAQAWILTNLTTRRILNMNKVEEMLQAPCLQDGKATPLRRPAMPKDLPLLGSITVPQQDIDINGHLNNAKYPGYALSFGPQRPVQEMTLSYSRECFAGETLQIYGHMEQDQAWFRGQVLDQESFDMLVRFFP